MRNLLQRLFRVKGYSDKDLWDLDYSLSHCILPRLIDFKKVNVTSHPIEFKNIKSWHKVIDKMIWSFQYIANDRSSPGESIEKINKDSKRCQKGLELFGKYFQDLWD